MTQEERQRPAPQETSAPSSAPRPQPEDDDTTCWICGATTVRVHCKIVCPVCGFRRDCSDP